MMNIKDPSSKMVRWRLSLEEYDYEVIYKPGKQNCVADGLSRIRYNNEEVNTISVENESMNNNADVQSTVHSADTDDSHFIGMTTKPINCFNSQLIFEISDNQNTFIEQPFPKINRTTIQKPLFCTQTILELLTKHLDFKKVNCILCPENLIPKFQDVYRNNFCQTKYPKIVIAQKRVEDLVSQEEQDKKIEEIHTRAHRGIDENLAVLSSKFFFPSMKAKLRKFIHLCTQCKTGKYDRNPPKPTFAQTPIPKQPLEIVHIDLFISGKNTFLSAVDKFSRYGMLFPIKSKAIADVRKALVKLFSTFGRIKMLVSDNEPAFKSIEIRGFLETLNIETYYTPVNKSEVNGIVERFHSTLAEIFRCIKHRHTKLSIKEIFKISLALYNESKHSAHNLTPKEVFYGIKDGEERSLDLEEILKNRNKIFDEVVLNLLKKQKQDLLNHNKNREVEITLQPNDTVYIARQGIRNKVQPMFVPVTVKENNNKTFTDEKDRKLHKANLKRQVST